MSELIRKYIRAVLLAVVDVAKIVIPGSFWAAVWALAWGLVGIVALICLGLVLWIL